MALKDLIDPRPVSEPDEKGSGPIEDVEEVAQVATGRVDRASDSQIPRGVSEVVTPSGISIYYQSEPKRLYRVNGLERPSVSTILDVLERGGLSWWGMKVGFEGLWKLLEIEELRWVN